jgi:hypothetical protein
VSGIHQAADRDCPRSLGLVEFKLRTVSDPKIVQEMVGPARISTTLATYSHVSPDMQDEAVKRFGSLFS